MKKPIAAFGVILVLCLLCCAFCFFKKEEGGTPSFGLFSWNMDATAEGEAETLNACIKTAGVTELYQEFTADALQDGTAAAFVSRMNTKDVSVYALVGSEDWVYEPEALLSVLRQIVQYNSTAPKNSKLCGVVVDVEPYLLDEWDADRESRDALMEDYLFCMESAYRYAAEQELFLWACIPTFYDRASKDVLEPLIAQCCDGVAVMNYNREDEYGQIAHEVGFAREYDKSVMCIYELQEAGKHGLEEINTYANLTLDDIQASWESLQLKFGYDKLSYAYHYYEPLCDLLR